MSVKRVAKYPKLIRQYSKTYGDFVDFQGADVFIITKYENQYCVVLFEDALQGGHITMPGGRCDTGHTNLSDVASEELFEESLKSIKVEPNVFEYMDTQNLKITQHLGINLITYVDITGARGGPRGYRRVYFCYMPSIDASYYYSNQVSLNSPTTEDEYKETVNLMLIPIDNIISIVSAPTFIIGRKTIKDINNIPYRVTRITMEAFYKFLNEYNKFTSISPRTMRSTPRKTSRTYKIGLSFLFPKTTKTTKTTTTTRTIKDTNLSYITNILSKIVVLISYELIINPDSTQTIKYIMI